MNRRAVDSDGRPGIDEKFNRRPAAAVALLLMVVAGMAVLTLAVRNEPVAAIEAPAGIASTIAASTPASTPSTTLRPERPPISANDFIPEDRDLTSCIGVLERPGCGSESRGGWRQTLVFVVLFVGLAIVFGNVVRGVRKRSDT